MIADRWGHVVRVEPASDQLPTLWNVGQDGNIAIGGVRRFVLRTWRPMDPNEVLQIIIVLSCYVFAICIEPNSLLM